jgi:LDH2 family malate/lactate/ureidoglycolate dehydrogenase
LQYLDQIRSSEPADPETSIRVAGDGAASRASTASRGGFSVDSRLWRELNCLLRPLVPARVGSVQ